MRHEVRVDGEPLELVGTAFIIDNSGNITVNGRGQLKRTAAAKGEIVAFQTTPSVDAVVGEDLVAPIFAPDGEVVRDLTRARATQILVATGGDGMFFGLVAACLAVLWPGVTSVVAGWLGIGRGADLVSYLAVAVMLLVSQLEARRKEKEEAAKEKHIAAQEMIYEVGDLIEDQALREKFIQNATQRLE